MIALVVAESIINHHQSSVAGCLSAAPPQRRLDVCCCRAPDALHTRPRQPLRPPHLSAGGSSTCAPPRGRVRGALNHCARRACRPLATGPGAGQPAASGMSAAGTPQRGSTIAQKIAAFRNAGAGPAAASPPRCGDTHGGGRGVSARARGLCPEAFRGHGNGDVLREPRGTHLATANGSPAHGPPQPTHTGSSQQRSRHAHTYRSTCPRVTPCQTCRCCCCSDGREEQPQHAGGDEFWWQRREASPPGASRPGGGAAATRQQPKHSTGQHGAAQHDEQRQDLRQAGGCLLTQ